jgi:hypothetical protein
MHRAFADVVARQEDAETQMRARIAVTRERLLTTRKAAPHRRRASST